MVETQWHGSLSENALLGLYWGLIFSCEIKFVENKANGHLYLLVVFTHLEKWSGGMLCTFLLFTRHPLSPGFIMHCVMAVRLVCKCSVREAGK